MSLEEAASDAALSGDEAPLPNLRADFPLFGSQSVDFWPNLPRRVRCCDFRSRENVSDPLWQGMKCQVLAYLQRNLVACV